MFKLKHNSKDGLKNPGLGFKVLAKLDQLFNKLFSQAWNPLYQSGTLAVFCLIVVIVTGVYLVFFYDVANPYSSVVHINQQIWLGKWIRSLHIYASNLSIIAIIFHVLRLWIQRRSWGARSLTWITGALLTITIFICAWSGFVMVWDWQAYLMVNTLSELIDFLHILQEPFIWSFQHSQKLPQAFFFLNLFLHVSLPLMLIAFLWAHTAKLARPTWLPPKKIQHISLLLLIMSSIFIPAPLGPIANPLQIGADYYYNLFFNFWLPLTHYFHPLLILSVCSVLFIVLTAVPMWHRKKYQKNFIPSFVDEKSCTGCTTCFHDCPYEAINMVTRTLGHGSELVAKVTADRCVSCGICAGSCAPMGVGPKGRTGRDQMELLQLFLEQSLAAENKIMLFHCKQLFLLQNKNIPNYLIPYDVHCAGNLHTSMIELALKKGCMGVVIATCPPRNCSNREGTKWLTERIYHGREADLRPQIDREQILVVASDPLTLPLQAIENFFQTLSKKQLDLSNLNLNLNLNINTECKNEVVLVK